MINANELRIGNWIWQTEGFPVQVKNIDAVGINSDVYTENGLGELQYDNYLANLNGIPLTPEILVKCGFEKTEYTAHKTNIIPEIASLEYFDYRLDNMVLSPIGKPISFFEIEYCALDVEERTYIAKCTYLHQLQNIYFSLTQTEIKYTL